MKSNTTGNRGERDRDQTGDRGPVPTPAAPRPSAFLTFQPHYYCPQCDGAIDTRCVHGSLIRPWIKDPAAPVQRRIEVYCQHCKIGFSATLQLAGDSYTVIEGPDRLTGRPLARLAAWCERELGNVQLKPKIEAASRRCVNSAP